VVDAEEQFRRIKLNGARFDGGRLPIDSLVELERYQDILRVLARSEWQREHPSELVPDGFDESISLTIESIEEGSADILLAIEQHAIYAAYQEQAQTALDVTIAAAYSGEELPDMPPAIAADVRQRIIEFGNTLEPTQSIQVYFANPAAEPVLVTPESRRQAIDRLTLIDFVSEPPMAPLGELQKQVESVVGRITEVDAESGKYRLESLQYGRLIGHYDLASDLIAAIRASVDSEADAPVLRVEGELQRRRDGSPWRFTSTHLVEVFAAGSEPWAPRLIELAELPHAWGDAEAGKAISFAALDAVNRIMKTLAEASAPAPALFATEEGGVILEWASLEVVRSIETSQDAEFELFLKRPGQDGALRVTNNLVEAIAFAKGDEA
jgi:hypothetical protein